MSLGNECGGMGSNFLAALEPYQVHSDPAQFTYAFRLLGSGQETGR